MLNENLLRYFLVCSDVEAALRLLDAEGSRAGGAGEHDRWRSYILRMWPQAFGDMTAFAKIYADGAVQEVARDLPWFQVPAGPRFQLTRQWLLQRPEIKSACDYGCGTGLFTVHFANEIDAVPHLTGIDYDAASIEAARLLATRRARAPERIAFRVGSEATLDPVPAFDCVICQETLEHVVDPIMTLRWIMASVRPGGWVCLSMPFGPLEHISVLRNVDIPGSHIREWTATDLAEVFAGQADLSIQPFQQGADPALGIMLGFTFVTFRVTGIPLREIDWSQKLSSKIATRLALPS